MEDGEVLYKDLCYNVVGAAMDVHGWFGNGFLEAVYQEALCLEMQLREIPFDNEVELPVIYKGMPLEKRYKADIIVDGKVLVELKSKPDITATEEAQLLNYLKCTGMRVGLIINFGAKSLQWKKMIL